MQPPGDRITIRLPTLTGAWGVRMVELLSPRRRAGFYRPGQLSASLAQQPQLAGDTGNRSLRAGTTGPSAGRGDHLPATAGHQSGLYRLRSIRQLGALTGTLTGKARRSAVRPALLLPIDAGRRRHRAPARFPQTTLATTALASLTLAATGDSRQSSGRQRQCTLILAGGARWLARAAGRPSDVAARRARSGWSGGSIPQVALGAKLDTEQVALVSRR